MTRGRTFGSVASTYERFRPGYPDQIVAEVAAYAERLEMVLKLAPFEWFNFFAFWDQKSIATTHETRPEL